MLSLEASVRPDTVAGVCSEQSVTGCAGTARRQQQKRACDPHPHCPIHRVSPDDSLDAGVGPKMVRGGEIQSGKEGARCFRLRAASLPPLLFGFWGRNLEKGLVTKA